MLLFFFLGGGAKGWNLSTLQKQPIFGSGFFSFALQPSLAHFLRPRSRQPPQLELASCGCLCGTATVFFSGVLGGKKWRKKERQCLPGGTLALWLEIWLSAGFSCLNGMEYSQKSLQAAASLSVWGQKIKKRKKERGKKNSYCCPRFNAHISAKEQGEKRGAGIYNTWPDVSDISGPGGNVRLWRDVFLEMIWLHHIRLLLPTNTWTPETSCCCGMCWNDNKKKENIINKPCKCYIQT